MVLSVVDHSEVRALIAGTVERAALLFGRSGCGPCDLVHGALANLLGEEGQFLIFATTIEPGVRGALARNLALGVKNYPTVAFLERGQIVSLHPGALLVDGRVDVSYVQDFLVGGVS